MTATDGTNGWLSVPLSEPTPDLGEAAYAAVAQVLDTCRARRAQRLLPERDALHRDVA